MNLSKQPTETLVLLFESNIGEGAATMLEFILNLLFGCSHQRTTFPLTPTRKSTGHPLPAASHLGTYVACLDCGKELAYDWDEMQVRGPVSPRQNAPEAQPSFR